MFTRQIWIFSLVMGAVVWASSIASAAGKEEKEAPKTYRMKVIGASIADQLATGLRWEFQGDARFKISQHTKAATGLIRDDVYDWQAKLENLLAEDDIDIAVVTLGGNDRQTFYYKGKRLRRFTDAWRAEYHRRIKRFMKTLKNDVPIVYWVSLPMVRSSQETDDFARMNGYFRDIAGSLGVTFFDIYGKFADSDGNYSAFGEALSGRKRRLRKRDGVHFTMTGARKLGKIVGDMILADLKARSKKARAVEAKGSTATVK